MTDREVQLHGRDIVLTDVDEITEDNVLAVLTEILPTVARNRAQEEYLYGVYRNITDIRFKEKDTRPEINHKVSEARAHQIVDFKTSYVGSDPIVLTNRSTEQGIGEQIIALNDMMVYNNRDAINKQVLDWMHITGHGYKMCLPDENGEAPFEVYSLDPRQTCVVYSTAYHRDPVMAFYAVTKRDENKVQHTYYTIYTKNKFFRVKDAAEVLETQDHALGMIPIIEFPLSEARMGVFEPVMDLLDAINYLDSDRMDGVTTFINSLCVIYNAQLPEGEDGNTIRAQGLVCLKSNGENKADIKILSEQLDQTSTQTLKNDLYAAISQIVGMPTQSDGSTSDSSNNGAALIKNGYKLAEDRAKETEVMFAKSERELMKLVLVICESTTELTLKLRDIDITFTRKQYSDIVSKSTVFGVLANSNLCAPIDAWEISGLSADPEACCKRGLEWREENKDAETANSSTTETIPVG